MSNYTHQTAPTQFVEANSIRRRLSPLRQKPEESGSSFSQHYIGTMDYWDPTVTDGLARYGSDLVDNAGVSSSSGEVPTTFERMGS